MFEKSRKGLPPPLGQRRERCGLGNDRPAVEQQDVRFDKLIDKCDDGTFAKLLERSVPYLQHCWKML